MISCITVIFFNPFSIRNFTLFFTFFHNYSTLNMSSISSVSGQVAVAVGFLTQDLSLIWNTDCRCHSVSFVMYIAGAKFEEHCLNISRVVLD